MEITVMACLPAKWYMDVYARHKVYGYKGNSIVPNKKAGKIPAIFFK